MSHQISLLIDTNVWMDYYDASRSGSKAAFKLINNALEHGAELVYTVPSSKDVFYLIGRAYKGVLRAVNQECSSEDLAAVACEMAWGCVRNMSEIATAVGCDGRDVWIAEKQKRLHPDYEDNLIIAASIRLGATLLVTNDEGLLRHAPVSALSVEDALKYLDTLE